MIIGIDLGTTNSVAAYMSEEGPRLIPNALGERLTPSVVGIDKGGELLVGRAAKELQVLQPDRCASIFKRYMGTDWSVELVGKKFTAEMLSSLVLKSLKQDAEAHFGKPVDRAVITVPAYFHDPQRQATLRAGQLAGFHVERIINEPTAAAIAYGFHESGTDKLIAVFDLGGGTFDVSVVEMFEGAVEVRASSGECFLGGEDFTRSMATRVLESRGMVFERAEMQMPKLVARVIQLCEGAKIRLSTEEETEVPFPNEQGELSPEAPRIKISREQFQKWINGWLARLELPIRRALGDAGLNRQQLNEVILVGGATRMPVIRERVREMFACEPRQRLNPDEVVALGAAVQAGLIEQKKSVSDMVVTDVAPFTLGVAISKQLGTEIRDGYYLPIINRNTTIPVSRVERVSTVHANQTEVKVRVYQGESRYVKDNLLLGEFALQGIPAGPAGQEVDIRLTYDLNGVLEVEATVVASKRRAGIVIARHARGLSEEEVKKAVSEMQALKTHPRDEAVNRAMLKRAERLFQELPIWLRTELTQILDFFEVAMNSGEIKMIGNARESLQEFLDTHDPDPLSGAADETPSDGDGTP